MGVNHELRFIPDVLAWIDRMKIEGSRYRNMRELRARNGSRKSIRMLFIFDPSRKAVFLVAGNKAENGEWSVWYTKAIPEAEARYADYLDALKEGVIA